MKYRSLAFALLWLVVGLGFSGCVPRSQSPELPYDAETITDLRGELDEFSG